MLHFRVYMGTKKLFRNVQFAAVGLMLVLLVAPRVAFANAQDEQAMQQTGTAIEDLWNFVDSSGNLTDDKFYPQFVSKAQVAHDTVLQSFQELQASSDHGRARSAVAKITQDEGVMVNQIDAWQTAAKSGDINAFETANNNLGDTVDTFNTDVSTYNAIQDNGHSAYDVAAYTAAPAFAFLLTCILFAWAFYRNDPQEEVIPELKRRLRWHFAYAGVLLLVGSAVPAVMFFWTSLIVSLWWWLAVAPGILALFAVLVRYARVLILSRRQAARA